MKKNTICVQGGYQPGNGEPRVLPIVQSTTYKYSTSEEMGKLFDLEESGYFYSRLANPTSDAVAEKINMLEGGVGAVMTSSGQAATMYAVTNICEAGDHVICAVKVYGGTSNLLSVTLKRFGIECSLVDQDLPEEEIAPYFKENTKVVFGETIANPAGSVLDIEKFARLAHSHGCPLIVDNTFATPINCRPLEWGADIVTHSTSKYMDGHAMALGGCVVDGGKFDWMAHAERYPGLTTPDESYHGIVYAEKFAPAGYLNKIVAQLMRDMGACPAPMNAFLTNVGLETLHLRVPRHCENALRIAEFLNNHEKVAWVSYAGLEGDKYHALAEKYLPDGVCGVLSFGPKGGRDGAMRFTNALKLIAIVTHVADARSCVLHPASHTHRQLNDEQLVQAGVLPELIRLSVGIEDVEDLIADLEQALAAV